MKNKIINNIKLLESVFSYSVPDIRKFHKKVKDSACTSCAANRFLGELLLVLHEDIVNGKYDSSLLGELPTVLQDQVKRGGIIKKVANNGKTTTEPAAQMMVSEKRKKPPVPIAPVTVRISCLDCCRKHLGQAIVLFQESAIPAYTNHFWLAIGHLSEMESEALSDYPEFSSRINKLKNNMISYHSYSPDLMSIFEEIDELTVNK